MSIIKLAGFDLLPIRSVSDICKGQLNSYGDVLNARNIKAPAFKKGLSDKIRDMSLPKNAKYLFGIVLGFFSFSFGGDGMLVYLFA